MTAKKHWVTACIPTYRCTRYLRGAVLSLLNQTYPFVRVVVINDGDPNPPWPALAGITDPRLIRFDLRENRGPYFALAIALEATPDPYFLIQDADDWSEPTRVVTLMQILQRDGSNYAFSTLAQFYETPSGPAPTFPLFPNGPDSADLAEFRNRIPHHGLFQSEAIRQLGGYYGGFRFGYDMFMTSCLLMAGSVSWTPQALYCRRLLPSSLSHSTATGWRSTKRQMVRAEMSELYGHIFSEYQRFIARQISDRHFLQLIRWRIQCRVSADDAHTIKVHAAILRRAMIAQSAIDDKKIHHLTGWPTKRLPVMELVKRI
jgi:glycosyltransferase involved in cell wall biosynthesis